MRVLTMTLQAAVLWGFWLLLVGTDDPQEMIVGAVVALLATAIQSAAGGRGLSPRWLHPRRLAAGLAYLPFLFWEIVKANVDVALRVIDPSLPIHPGIVRVRTRLRHPVARMILANSITLTPGTLTVDVRGEDLFIHWVDVRTTDTDKASREIAAGFERFLEVIFE